MKFSEAFGIERTPHEDWFDPILTVDTRLFVDPFLIYDREEGHFEGAHNEIIAFFNSAFHLIARAKGDQNSLSYLRTVHMLRLPEVEEICLGYAAAGTRGAGSGRGIAVVMAAAIWEAIEEGVQELSHFEEISILREGIGADRISDATAAILRRRLAAYTKEICHRYGVPTEEFGYVRGWYDVEVQRWRSLAVELPRNPISNKGILLVPQHYLRDLPTVNASDFWAYAYVNENEAIRNDFSYDVTSNVSKAEIIAFAKRHPEARERYLRYREERRSKPYPLTRDPNLLYRWYEESKSYVANHPLQLIVKTEDDFQKVIRTMIDEYRHYVEQNKGWRLLWNENQTPRREAASQDLFLGTIRHYCKANDIDVSREPDIGRGPVDFKVSSGHQLRALIEVKLARNTKFWDGLEKQLPTYQKAEGVKLGFFLVVAYTEDELTKVVPAIGKRVEALNKKLPYVIESIVVDARYSPPSASKL